MAKHFEFWHPRAFESPYYLYLCIGAWLRGLSIKSLAKANYALDHGEIGIGSKFTTQMAFNQSRFLPTELVPADASLATKVAQVKRFGAAHGYPLILKSDIGSVGKGVLKLQANDAFNDRLARLRGHYLLQAYTPHNLEYGVFYVRSQGRGRITGINRKHFPTVIGNGVDSIECLARAHYRYTDHWQTFLQYLDITRVPTQGELVQLSFIGSHTMGCKFTDDSHLLTDSLLAAVEQIFADQPGFNFGRLDLKCVSEAAFKTGEFLVIEVNGVASLPTHMFDPSHSLRRGYQIFFEHGRWLLKIAAEQRRQPMSLDSYRHIAQRVSHNYRLLNDAHQQLMTPDSPEP
jgi:hypothetical protein